MWTDRPGARRPGTRLPFPWLSLLWLMATVALLGAMVPAVSAIVGDAASGFLVQRIRVTMAADDTDPVHLGWNELGHAGDDRPALAVRRGPGGSWAVSALPDAPALSMQAPQRRRLDARPLAAGQRFDGPGTAFEVVEASAERVVLGQPGRRLTVTADGRVEVDPPMLLSSCRLKRLEERWPDWLLDLEATKQRWQRGRDEPIVGLGGGVDCPGRWAVAGLVPDSLGLVRTNDVQADGGWALVPRQGAGGLRVAIAGRPPEAAFAALPAALPEADAANPVRLRFGRLTLSVWAEGNTLILLPTDGRVLGDWPPVSADMRVDVEPDAAAWLGKAGIVSGEAALSAERVIVGAGAAAGAGLAVAAALAAAAGPGRRWRLVGPGLLAAGLAAGGTALLMVALAGRSAAGMQLALAVAGALWGWAGLCLAARGWLAGIGGAVWLLFGALAGAGLLALLQLVAGGTGETRVALVWKQTLGLGSFALALGLAAMPGPAAWRRGLLWALALDRPGRIALWLGVLAGVAGLAVAHGLFGREGGLGGIQPAEAFKTAWPLLFAVAAGWFLHLVRLGAPGTVWPAAMAGGVAALGLVGVTVAMGLLAVDDRSPLLLLAIVSAVWLYHLAVRSAAALRCGIGRASAWGRAPLALVVAGVVASAAAAGLAASWPDDAWDGLLAEHDRLAAWADPDLYPVSGGQVRKAQEALARAPGLAAPLVFTGRNGEEQAIPAIENDFAITFWIMHAGRAGAMGLLAAQLALLALLGLVASRLSWPPGDPERPPALGDTLQFLLVGLTVLLACHWLIAWANPLGLLPVMGQSATLLSAGTSHLLFFTWPLAFTALLAAAVAKEA
ncbi:cell division protein FtsW [Azospirillum agricola]|uniref:FtsW/RodA/SpoVE family cell cycle protein n=1 Tax=Azospirillum agricola TaxID=1720247 RepID=UPI001AE12F3C|nr:FtsW/RodA/SpoVE family cell cycle protein [Azospirillum agricola]MBP2230021.1 cell division protein FtsW [Azospirillum agricola]